jgi:hypothetical protein
MGSLLLILLLRRDAPALLAEPGGPAQSCCLLAQRDGGPRLRRKTPALLAEPGGPAVRWLGEMEDLRSAMAASASKTSTNWPTLN